MNALKTQQFRWTKGAAECARKNLWKVLRSAKISLSTKIHAFFHLMNSFLFICIITTAVLSVPLLLIKNNFNEYASYYRFGVFFMISLVLLIIFYWVSSIKQYDNKLLATLNFILKFPAFLSISMGLSLHNAIAVFEGYTGRKTPFIRTPKFNITKKGDIWKDNIYLTRINPHTSRVLGIGVGINLLTIFEGLFSLYFAAGIIISFILKDYGLLPFHIMLSIGFGSVFYYSIDHSK